MGCRSKICDSDFIFGEVERFEPCGRGFLQREDSRDCCSRREEFWIGWDAEQAEGGLRCGGCRIGLGSVESKPRVLGSERGYRVADEAIGVVVMIWGGLNLNPHP